MKKIRYPFQKNTLPKWVEVPFDATDRSVGTIEVQLADLPQEKFKTLRAQLQSATVAYLQVQTSRWTSEALIDGEVKGPSDDDLSAALAVIKASEKITPALQRILGETIANLAKQRSESAAAPEEAKGVFLSGLRLSAPAGGEFGYTVLGLAEALAASDTTAAGQRIAEELEPRQAEALGALSRAREKIVAFGVTNHRGFVGELVDEQGQPMIDEAGLQIEQPLPFTKGKWLWNGKPKPGCAEETVNFYREISQTGGLILSLSEAVLLYQRGVHPTPEEVWSPFAPPLEAPAAAAPEAPPAEAAHPDDVGAEAAESEEAHPDDAPAEALG